MPYTGDAIPKIHGLTLHDDGRFELAGRSYELWEELSPTSAGEWTVAKRGSHLLAERADGEQVTYTYGEAGWTRAEEQPSKTCQPVTFESYLLPMVGVQKDKEGNDVYTPWATCQFGDIVFKGDGTVVLGNRAFVDGQPINGFRFTGGVAKRPAGFKQTLEIAAPDNETYHFGYYSGWWYRFLPIDAHSAPERGLGYWVRREIATHGVFGALVRLGRLAIGLAMLAYFTLAIISCVILALFSICKAIWK
jgi:hypothetical protein